MSKNSSAIILASGFSSRMNYPKAFLQFSENKCFAQEIADKFDQFGCEEIVLVLNKENKEFCSKKKFIFPENVKICINPNPENGRFSSIKTGVSYLKNKNSSCFIHNVDNPFISVSVLNELYNNLKNNQFVTPTYKNKGGHPVLLSQEITNKTSQLENYEKTLRDFLWNFERINIPVNMKEILYNINTPEEYVKYFNL